ncbi:hypothetical protein [Micromonospora sp. ALFpr18c]|nr:hypothetical protein [Micromonospora sp. ALFpr18c]
MPQDKRKLTRTIRDRSDSTGETYTQARDCKKNGVTPDQGDAPDDHDD